MCRLHHNIALDPCGPGSSSKSSGTHRRTLLDLPSEIHLAIISYADYYDLKSLRKTDKYLRNIIEVRQVRRALKQVERRPLYKGHNSVQLTKFPCYDCLEILNSTEHFSLSMTTGDYRYCGPFSYNRRCMSCQHAGKSAFIDRSKSQHFHFEGSCWLDCKLCQTTRSCRKKEDAEHLQRVCDVCYKEQQEIWPTLGVSERLASPPDSHDLKRSLFRRKASTRVVVSEVASIPVKKGFLRPTESFLKKAKRKIKLSIPTTKDQKNVLGRMPSSPIARVLSWRA